MRMKFPSGRLGGLPLAAGFALTAFLALTGPVAAQDSRDNKFVLAADGSLLWVRDGVGGTDDGSDLVRRSGGSDTTLSTFHACLVDCGGDNLLQTGLGAFPDMNSSGTVVFQANISDTPDPDLDGGGDPQENLRSALLVRAVGDGASTLVARAHQTSTTAGERTLVDGDGDGTVDDGLCDIEPMPQIHDSGQLGFGAFVVRNNEALDNANACGETSSALSDFPRLWKDIFRWASGTLTVMLRANHVLPADPVVVGASQSIPAGTYYVTDVDLNDSMRKEALNASGHILVRANIDDTFTDDTTLCSGPLNGGSGCSSSRSGVNSSFADDRRALLLLTSSATRTLVVGTSSSGAGPYQALEDGQLNDAGQVLYKAETLSDSGSNPNGAAPDDCGRGAMDDWDDNVCAYPSDDEFLNLWSAGVTSTVASQGDALPGGSSLQMVGFTPHHDLNNSGDVAFVAGLDESPTNIACGDLGSSQHRQGDLCQAVFVRSGASNIEIARSTAATAEDAAPGAPSVLDGFNFEDIAGRALLQENGTIFFMAENYDVPAGAGDCTLGDLGNEQTMIVAWSTSNGLISVLRENEILPNGQRVIRIFAPEQPASNGAGQIYVKAQLGPDDGSCDVLAENQTFLLLAGPASSVLEIPTAGRTGLVVLSLLLLTAAGVLFRRAKATHGNVVN